MTAFRREWGVAAVLAAVLGLASLAADAPEPAGLVPNGDFEAGAAGESTVGKLPPEWAKPFVTPAPLQIVSETRPGSPGKQCLKIDTSEKVKNGGVWSRLIPVDPSRPLTVSGWAKVGGVLPVPQGAYVGVGWYDKDKKPIPIRQGTEMNYVYLLGGHKEENWRQFKGTFAPAAKAAEGQPAFTEAEIPPTAAFFDIRLFMLEYPKPGFFDDVSASQPEAVKP